MPTAPRPEHISIVVPFIVHGAETAMGIFDTIIDREGKSHQTKWFPLEEDLDRGPLMRRFRVGERVPELDGDYKATEEGEGTEMVVVVRQGRVVDVHPKSRHVAEQEKTPDPVQQAIALLQDLYNNDVLFVKLPLQERSEYDKRMARVLDVFGADYDGKRPAGQD